MPDLLGSQVYYCENNRVFSAIVVGDHGKCKGRHLVSLTVFNDPYDSLGEGVVVRRVDIPHGTGEKTWAYNPGDL